MDTQAHGTNLKGILQSFIEGDLLAWRGLPVISAASFMEAYGQPNTQGEAELGWFPAVRYTWNGNEAQQSMTAYARNGELVLIETKKSPPVNILKQLGKPSVILPHEFLIPDTYVHEYVYCSRGLVLSVAEPFSKGLPHQIVRCRGIKIMSRPSEYGPEYYQSFEDQTVWS